ncbi:hypothetical protein V8G54_035804 [Vigna mungo]|uniref:Uncharacterized protein n=1 Tax=Vigna mungo TaxID=3915 RepID=A0AAQ3MG57_VIGMU
MSTLHTYALPCVNNSHSSILIRKVNWTNGISSDRFIHDRVMNQLNLKQNTGVPLSVIGSIQQEENENNSGNSFQIDTLLLCHPNQKYSYCALFDMNKFHLL